MKRLFFALAAFAPLCACGVPDYYGFNARAAGYYGAPPPPGYGAPPPVYGVPSNDPNFCRITGFVVTPTGGCVYGANQTNPYGGYSNYNYVPYGSYGYGGGNTYVNYRYRQNNTTTVTNYGCAQDYDSSCTYRGYGQSGGATYQPQPDYRGYPPPSAGYQPSQIVVNREHVRDGGQESRVVHRRHDRISR